MNAYRWTVRVALGGVTLLVLWDVFVAVARIFGSLGIIETFCVTVAPALHKKSVLVRFFVQLGPKTTSRRLEAGGCW